MKRAKQAKRKAPTPSHSVWVLLKAELVDKKRRLCYFPSSRFKHSRIPSTTKQLIERSLFCPVAWTAQSSPSECRSRELKFHFSRALLPRPNSRASLSHTSDHREDMVLLSRVFFSLHFLSLGVVNDLVCPRELPSVASRKATQSLQQRSLVKSSSSPKTRICAPQMRHALMNTVSSQIPLTYVGRATCKSSCKWPNDPSRLCHVYCRSYSISTSISLSFSLMDSLRGTVTFRMPFLNAALIPFASMLSCGSGNERWNRPHCRPIRK